MMAGSVSVLLVRVDVLDEVSKLSTVTVWVLVTIESTLTDPYGMAQKLAIVQMAPEGTVTLYPDATSAL